MKALNDKLKEEIIEIAKKEGKNVKFLWKAQIVHDDSNCSGQKIEVKEVTAYYSYHNDIIDTCLHLQANSITESRRITLSRIDVPGHPAFANTPENAIRCLVEYCKRSIDDLIRCIADAEVQKRAIVAPRGW